MAKVMVEVDYGGGSKASICITNGKITSYFYMKNYTEDVKVVKYADYGFHSYVRCFFEMLMEHRLEAFKSMLRKIENSDPYFYKLGSEMLKSKREACLEQAEKLLKEAEELMFY